MESLSTASSVASPGSSSSSAAASRQKVIVHIEVEISSQCSLSVADVTERVTQALTQHCPVFLAGAVPIQALDASLSSIVQSITICDLPVNHPRVSFWQAELSIHAFRLSEEPPESEYLDEENGDGEQMPIAEQTELPNVYLKGLWEAIILDEALKATLLSYACTSIIFAKFGVDTNLISWNKMILLHGPPGTGKTSLCKSLAQKVIIRNSQRFTNGGLLFEVNCHSLFSKWFSESGKLVMKLFKHISEVAEDSECLVVLLIDEVESIAAARTGASKAGEPGDAIRVVNAVLTSLDALRKRQNVLVLCTSNMSSSLDEAFLDRLDLNIYLGNPNLEARSAILTSCVQELINKGLLSLTGAGDEKFGGISLNTASTSLLRSVVSNSMLEDDSCIDVQADLDAIDNDAVNQAEPEEILNKMIMHIAVNAEGCSGRALRKLPIRTYAQLMPTVNRAESGFNAVSLKVFLNTMFHMISQDKKDKQLS